MTALLGKLIRMLSSDKPGEVVAAAAAINRSLRAGGRDIHDLASAVDQLNLPLATTPQPRPSTPKRSSSAPRRPGGNLQMGDRVLCEEVAGPFRRCRCGCDTFTVTQGVGPHAAQLRCDNCHCGGRWLGRAYFGTGRA
jgi:hypothetical protein